MPICFKTSCTASLVVGNFRSALASSPSLYFPRLVTYASITAMSAPLAFDGQDTLQGGGGDPQPLGNGDVILHCFIDIIPAHHQHTGAPEQIAPHINTALCSSGTTSLRNNGR